MALYKCCIIIIIIIDVFKRYLKTYFSSLLTTRRFSALETQWLCAIHIDDYDYDHHDHQLINNFINIMLMERLRLSPLGVGAAIALCPDKVRNLYKKI